VTRPAMAMGVTYSALLINGMTTVELFLLTKNLLWMLVCIPIHGIFWLVCKNDARFSTCCSCGAARAARTARKRPVLEGEQLQPPAI